MRTLTDTNVHRLRAVLRRYHMLKVGKLTI